MDRKLWVGLVVGTFLFRATPTLAATINVPGDYSTIGAAVTAAASGDTINVAAGTYPEQVIIDKAVSVLGAGAAITFIDGTGVIPVLPGLVNITNETGAVTLDGFTIRNAPPSGGTRITIWARQADEGPVYSSSMTITHNVLVGSGYLVSTNDYGLYSKYNKSNLVFSYNDVSNFGGNAFLFELHTGQAEISHNTIAVDPGCGSTAFFSMSYKDGYANNNDVTGKQWLHNNTINANGESAITIASAVGFAAYNDTTYGKYTNVEITDNVITNVGDDKKGIQLEVDGDNGGFVSPIIAFNTISAQNPGSGTSRGIRIMGDMSDAQILDNVITGFYRGIYQSDSFFHFVYPTNTQISGNVTTGGTYGIDIAGGTVTIHLNSIADNTFFGVNNQTVATIDATNNWWGDYSGPSGGVADPVTGTLANGSGDSVSTYVLFDPWLRISPTVIQDGVSGCFIATAAFGTPLAKQIEILRQFRDNCLLNNSLGKKFVSWYYRTGPVAARYIVSRPIARAAVRIALYPLIAASFLLLKGILPCLVLVLFVMILYSRTRRAKVVSVRDT